MSRDETTHKSGHYRTVPIVLRPSPPLPVMVSTAAQVFGNDGHLALIRFYSANPGASQTTAATALALPQQVISRYATSLLRAGVLVTEINPEDRRRAHYSVSQARLDELLATLTAYLRS